MKNTYLKFSKFMCYENKGSIGTCFLNVLAD
jgi:hypothetical protein